MGRLSGARSARPTGRRSGLGARHLGADHPAAQKSRAELPGLSDRHPRRHGRGCAASTCRWKRWATASPPCRRGLPRAAPAGNARSGWSREVLPSAFTIAFLAGIEALLSAVVADGMTGYRHRSGQELVGMGVANIASAAFGGLPATGAIARTATNVRAGAQTPMAGMLHALFLLVFMLAGRGPDRLRADGGAGGGAADGRLGNERGRPVRRPAAHRPGRAGTAAPHLHAHHLRRPDRRDRRRRHAGGAAVHAADERDMPGWCRSMPDGGSGAARPACPRGVEVLRFTGPIFFGVASEMIEALRPSSLLRASWPARTRRRR